MLFLHEKSAATKIDRENRFWKGGIVLKDSMEKDIEIKGIRLHYEETGIPDAPPVILMHGWGCDHTTVRSIAAALEDRMRVINVDLPGHGKSQEPPEVWGVEDFTQVIEELAQKLGLGTPDLIGHSFGGRIAILMSSRNAVGKLVLVDAAGIKPKRPLKYYWKVYSFKVAKKLLPMVMGQERGGKMIEKWRSSRGSADYRNSSPMMRAVMSRCVNEDLKRVMPDIKGSALLIWGEEDTATPLRDAKTMERLIPDSGLVSFPGCGHYSFLDNPIQFKAVIRSFFK